jgi:hypothetical protein
MDPSTVIAIVGAVASFIQSLNQQVWQDDVSSKLDEISSKLDEVLRELRELKIWFSEALDEEVRRVWSSQIDSDRHTLDSIIAGMRGNPPKPDSVTKNERLYPLLNDIQLVTQELSDAQRFGVTHFIEVTTGFAVTLAAMSLLDRPKGEMKVFCQTVLSFFDFAINVNWPNSFARGTVIAIDDYVQLSHAASRLLNHWWVIDRQTEIQKFCARAIGSPDSGITRVDTEYFEGTPDPFPGGHTMSVEGMRGVIQSAINQYQERVVEYNKLADYEQACKTIGLKIKSIINRL